MSLFQGYSTARTDRLTDVANQNFYSIVATTVLPNGLRSAGGTAGGEGLIVPAKLADRTNAWLFKLGLGDGCDEKT